MRNVIVKVEFNNYKPSKYDYKYFRVILKSGHVQVFHYHKNNPIPTESEMLGLTWGEVIELARKKFYEAIKGYVI